MDKYVDTGALLQVILASVLGGAGLVAVFSLGLVGTSFAGPSSGRATAGRRVAGLSLAAVSFLIVAAGVVLGIYAMLHKPA
jgi:hypothetical protein